MGHSSLAQAGQFWLALTPEVKSINQQPFNLDDSFKEALKQAMESASGDSSRYVLNGACLDVRDRDAHYVVGSDGRHLFSANSFKFNLPGPLIIPTRKFVVWPGFINDGTWKIRMLPGIKVDPQDKKADKSKEAPPWLQIDSAHWSYVAQAIDGQYPNWKQAVPSDTNGWTNIVLQPKAVETILDALPLLPGNEDINRGVRLVAGSNGLALRAKSKDQSDWTTISVPDASVTGMAVEVSINRGFLLQALRFGLNRIQVRDVEPLIFSNGGKMMVVMPLRIEGQDKPAPAPKSEPSQNENAPAAPPSVPEAKTQTAVTPVSATATTTPERGNTRATNGANGHEENGESRSTFKAALEQIDRIKTNLRDVMGDLNDAVTMLKNAEKEQRASAKEIQTVRAKLREIQSVEI